MGFVRASGGKREEGEEGNHLAEEARSKNIFSLFCLHSFFLHTCLGGGKKLKQKAVIATARAGGEEKKRALTYSFFSFLLVGKKKLHLAREREKACCVFRNILINFRTEAEADGSDKSPPDLLL